MTAPPPAASGTDRTTLWGVLGIILAFCCWPAGVVFAILSLLEARKHGNQPTLAYVGLIIAAVVLVFGGGLLGSGAVPGIG